MHVVTGCFIFGRSDVRTSSSIAGEAPSSASSRFHEQTVTLVLALDRAATLHGRNAIDTLSLLRHAPTRVS